MLLRVQRLFSHAATIPWLVFLWTSVEILERFEYFGRNTRVVARAIMTPAGLVVLLVLSVVALMVVMTWPGIKSRLPGIHYQTIHERLGDIESKRLPKLTQNYTDTVRHLDDIEAEFRKQLGLLEARWSETVPKVGSVTEKIGALESRVKGTESRVHTQECFRNSLEQVQGGIGGRLVLVEKALTELERYRKQVDDYVVANRNYLSNLVERVQALENNLRS
ncbi:MAG: hypothetical protein ABSC23_01445 [Bryobacteraceae bacterium]|jgi:tetrahydromethanopterin S-methyltransferase subunit G